MIFTSSKVLRSLSLLLNHKDHVRNSLRSHPFDRDVLEMEMLPTKLSLMQYTISWGFLIARDGNLAWAR